MRIQHREHGSPEGAQHRQRVLVRVSVQERAQLRQASGLWDCVLCETDAEFFESYNNGDVCGILWGLSPRTIPRIQAIPDHVLRAAARVPLLIRTDVSRLATHEIVALAKTTLDWRVSFRGFDDLATDVRALLNEPANTEAYQNIVSAVARNVHRVDPAVHDIVLAAAILGRRRLEVGEFVERCGWKVGAVQSRLRKAGAPVPRQLLGWSLLLHVAWWIGILGTTPKEAAYRAGYEGPGASAALGEFVYEHVGIRSRALALPGTFVALLRRFIGSICSGGAGLARVT